MSVGNSNSQFYFQLWQTEAEWGIWSGFPNFSAIIFKLFSAQRMLNNVGVLEFN